MRYACTLCFFLLGNATASVILQTGGQTNVQYAVSSGEVITTSWHFTTAFSNVGILVQLDAGLNNTGIPRAGSAFLTKSIGPGTGSNSQLGLTAYTFPMSPTTLQLFSGLTLAPGTYFLTLSSVDDLGGGWDATSSPFITSATGASLNQNYFANTGNQNLFFPPASTFTAGLVYTPLFLITGDPISTPEPSSMLLALSGCLALVRKCAKSSCRARSQEGGWRSRYF